MKKYLIMVCTISLICGVASAETDDATITVTATRSPREVTKVPASVTVVDRSEIDNSGAWNMDDLLRRSQGVFVLRSVGMGAGLPSQINMRGVPGQHATLLLVDGFPLNESVSGYTSVNEVPIKTANRVEIVRGPFSALYGTDAFAGVVNVITRDPEDMPAAEISARIGNEGFQQYSVSGSMGDKSRGLTVSLDSRSSDNYLGRDDVTQSWFDQASGGFVDITKDAENYDYVDQRLSTKFMMDLGEDSRLELYGRYYDSKLGYGQSDYRPVYPVPVDSGIEDQTLFLGAKLSSFITDDVKARFVAYYREQEKTSSALNLSHMMGVVPVYVPTDQTTEGSDWKAEAGVDVRFSEEHLLVLGVDFLVNDADFSPLQSQATDAQLPTSQGADESVQNTGLFFQDEFRFLERFELITGLRFDAQSEFGDAWSPKAGLLFEATDDTVVRTSVGRSYRAPTLLELYQPATMFGNIVFQSNPDLDPEYIVSADIGATHRFSDSVSAHVDVFYNDMDELIVKRVTGSSLSFDNSGDAWSAGVEAGVEWDVLEDVTTFVNYTGQQTEDKDTNEDLEHMPDHAVNIGVTVEKEMGDCVAMVSVMESFIGERGYVDFSSGQWRDLDSYWRTDISAKVTYKENAWVGVSVENTFDEEYQEWPLVNNAPSRLYAFEAGYRF